MSHHLAKVLCIIVYGEVNMMAFLLIHVGEPDVGSLPAQREVSSDNEELHYSSSEESEDNEGDV